MSGEPSACVTAHLALAAGQLSQLCDRAIDLAVLVARDGPHQAPLVRLAVGAGESLVVAEQELHGQPQLLARELRLDRETPLRRWNPPKLLPLRELAGQGLETR